VALKIELGGGKTPKGEGFRNVDKLPGADVVFDFETLSETVKLPFSDDSAMSIYSSHCIEHVRNLVWLMREIVRIGMPGCIVEIRVPHWNNSMAMCFDHKHTIAPEQVEHWTQTAVPFWFGDGPKALKLFHQVLVPGRSFQRWKSMLPQATDQDILELCPDACHESQWVFHVVKR
jgi:hypothetical protein